MKFCSHFLVHEFLLHCLRLFFYDDDDDDDDDYDDDDDSNSCVTLHVRIANRMVMGSCCRGGVVHSRGGCSCVRGIRSNRPTAIWRFRASTSNSPSDRTRL